MKLTTKEFDDALLFTLENKTGFKATLTDLGASITGIYFIDKYNNQSTVAFGSDESNFYKNTECYMGASVGRFANRIIKGRFHLDEKEYNLSINENENHLHGGINGFSFKKFEASTRENKDSISVIFTYESKDGEEGYPGNVSIKITYTLNEDNELSINYIATTDKATPLSLTNHAYWNLNGKGTILDHELEIKAPFYLPENDEYIATGEILSVHNTGYDFTKPKKIGKDVDQTYVKGYDACFVFSDTDITKYKARAYSKETGIALEIFTNKPALHFYSGFLLNNFKVRDCVLNSQDAFCLETELLPCSPNYTHFRSSILRPTEVYNYTTIHKLSLLK